MQEQDSHNMVDKHGTWLEGQKNDLHFIDQLLVSSLTAFVIPAISHLSPIG
jgi:hypothetical protein